ncbi:hypothetical protein Tco_1562368 [Tanacetum coccineum]
MEWANKDEFLAEKDKSHKRGRNDQDPPLLPPDSDPSSFQLLLGQKSSPHSEQPVEDVPIPDDVNFQMEECHLLLTDQVDLVNPEGHRVMHDVSKPLPLGGPPGQIESEWDYDISAAYGISHWWFKISRLFERYGYTFLKEIVLRRANYKEYKILEADFKNLHPNDFEDLYLLHLQGQLNHLSGANKVHLFNAVNLWIRNIIIRKRVEDLQHGIEISKPRAVIYRDINDQKKMMRETEVHKFSDGTLNRILDKLDHMVKDFKLFKYNSGMETRIWYEDDRRLKIMRIYRSLESFVGGRVRDVDYSLIQRTE